MLWKKVKLIFGVFEEVDKFCWVIYFNIIIVVVLGDFGVGKSLIICYIVGEVFIYEYVFIVEEFYVK